MTLAQEVFYWIGVGVSVAAVIAFVGYYAGVLDLNVKVDIEK